MMEPKIKSRRHYANVGNDAVSAACDYFLRF